MIGQRRLRRLARRSLGGAAKPPALTNPIVPGNLQRSFRCRCHLRLRRSTAPWCADTNEPGRTTVVDSSLKACRIEGCGRPSQHQTTTYSRIRLGNVYIGMECRRSEVNEQIRDLFALTFRLRVHSLTMIPVPWPIHSRRAIVVIPDRDRVRHTLASHKPWPAASYP